MTLTLDLLSALANHSENSEKTLVEHAKKNKVLLQLLRNTDEKGSLRTSQERGYQTKMAALRELSGQLVDSHFSLIKFNKPVLYSPADIDLLIMREELPGVVSKLVKLGYSQRTSEPYCVTLEKEVILDLYTNPCVANVPYIDGGILLEHARETQIADFFMPSLEKEAESMLAAAHAVYKEQLFTLNDYLTFNEWFGPLTEDLARKVKVEPAVRTAEILSQRVRQGQVDLPYRLGFAEISKIFSRKVIDDYQTRASVVRALTALHSREFVSKVRASRTRSTY